MNQSPKHRPHGGASCSPIIVQQAAAQIAGRGLQAVHRPGARTLQPKPAFVQAPLAQMELRPGNRIVQRVVAQFPRFGRCDPAGLFTCSMPAPRSFTFVPRLERQRRSVPQPRVAARRLPWDPGRPTRCNPNGVVSPWHGHARQPRGNAVPPPRHPRPSRGLEDLEDTTPLGLGMVCRRVTQGWPGHRANPGLEDIAPLGLEYAEGGRHWVPSRGVTTTWLSRLPVRPLPGPERQRRSVLQPRVAAPRLPWDPGRPTRCNPNGVVPL